MAKQTVSRPDSNQVIQVSGKIIIHGQVCLNCMVLKLPNMEKNLQVMLAQYAIDHLNADYKANALAKAKNLSKQFNKIEISHL